MSYTHPNPGAEAEVRLPNGRRMLTHRGITDTVTGWARRLGMRRDSLSKRLHKGWTVEEALETPCTGRGDRDARLALARAERNAAWAPADDYVQRRRTGVRYEDCAASQMFVNAHPHGATLDEIGAFFGVSRERIRQVEQQAMAKLAAARPELADLLSNDDSPRLAGQVSGEIWGGVG